MGWFYSAPGEHSIERLITMSMKEELLTMDEKMQIRFISAGLVAVLGSQEIRDNPLFMSTLSQTEIGKAMISTMKRISARQEKEHC